MKLTFDWDPTKARLNRTKHGVSLACRVFDHPLHESVLTPYQDGEERWPTIGVVTPRLLLVVAQTYRAGVIRIISARRATQRERSRYEEGH